MTKKASNGKYGQRGYFDLLFSNFFRLICLNLLTVLCCLPAVTIPAAASAACRSLNTLIMGNPCYFWQEYWKEFRQKFPQKLGAWLIAVLLPVSVGLWIRMLGGSGKVSEWAFTVFFALSAIVQCYFFPMTATVELPVTACVKNALLLTVLEWKNSLIMLLVMLALGFVVYNLYPYSIAAVTLILVSAALLFTCRRSIAAFEKNGLLIKNDKTENNQIIKETQ